MKEKIDQYAKGIFEYRAPAVVVNPEKLQITVDAGEIYRGRFSVSNEQKRAMKGIVCTDCDYMILEEDAFQGEESEISFLFRGTYCQPGEVIRGAVKLLTNCGNVILPFTVMVTVPSCDASVGKLRDLNQFAALAKENVPEALRLFSSSHFEEVFLSQNEMQRELYRGFVKGNNKAVAMEEFLIAIHKKIPVQLTVEKKELQYPKCEKAFADKIILHKDTWGYCEYTVHSDASFLCVEHSCIKTTDFVGDTYELSFVIHPEYMAAGHNFARITVSNARQTISVDVIARRFCISDEERKQWIGQQKDVWQLYQNFLYYHAGKLPWKEYSVAVERLICNLDTLSHGEGRYDWLIRVFRIHLALNNHMEETFHLEMAQLEDQLVHLEEEQPLLYCAYYYLLFLWNPEASGRADALARIRECYQGREHHWLVLWFLLQMDETYEQPAKRQDAILEQLSLGVHSPVMYLELCRLYNSNPKLLTELTAERAQALHWGCTHAMLGKELRFRYAYLIGRQRYFSSLMLEDLCRMYDRNPSDDLLSVICQMLMRDRRISPEDLKWYRLGIEHNIKLTELYEYYMYALGELTELELPDKVLLYFSYNNQLNAPKRAMLYEYIIRHKKRDKATYDTYYPAMQHFAMEQLEQGRINRQLAVVYEEFITQESLDETIAHRLPAILFSREIICHDADITGVVVRHREIRQEEHAALVKGRAVVSTFTDAAQIFLVDREGNRFAGAIDYTSHRMLHLEHLAQSCLSFVGDNARLLLYLYEKAVSLNQTGENIANLRARVLEISGLDSDYRKKVFAAQMQYYFDNFQGELLEYHLNRMDWDQVAPGDRERFLEYCAVRHCYDKGMEGILQFGCGRLDAKRLLQISSAAFQGAGERDDALVKLAWHIFEQGQFDESVLQYLCDYYSGRVQEMVQIWKAAAAFEIDVSNFSERILAQSLFTDEMCPQVYDIFFFYEESGYNKKLQRAFLKRAAYRYLVHGEMLPEKIFASFYRHVQVEENLPCLLAVLRQMGQREQLTGSETVFADYNLHQLYEKNIVLAFYQDFCGKVSLPDRVMKEQYVEYIADPAHTVKIQYCIKSQSGSEKPVTEIMADVFEGIRVRGFVLFQDETLEYRIIDQSPDGGEQITEPAQLGYVDRMTDADGSNGYRMLNQMMLLRGPGDEERLLDLMQKYAQKKEAAAIMIKKI